jgi:hypothetical protein
MTPEDRARIARQNGAKSKGPKTAEGKAKSARNSIKSGEHADKFAPFIPPDAALLCNEDRQNFYRMMDSLIAIYQPVNEEALEVVRQITIARWQIERCNCCITMHWNLAMLDAGQQPITVVPELASVQVMARASETVNAGLAIVERLNRQIDRLQMRVARLRRSLKYIHDHFPGVTELPPEKRTQPETQPATENKDVTAKEPEKIDESLPPVYVTERSPMVIAAYRREFPGRKIILLPPDNVALGIDEDDDLPVAPRRQPKQAA